MQENRCLASDCENYANSYSAGKVAVKIHELVQKLMVMLKMQQQMQRRNKGGNGESLR